MIFGMEKRNTLVVLSDKSLLEKSLNWSINNLFDFIQYFITNRLPYCFQPL